MEWLKKLADYFQHSDPPQVRIDMLAEVFGREMPDVMDAAIAGYIADRVHFPQVAELRPYVEASKTAGRTTLERIKNLTPEEKARLDEQILAWERERGTLPSKEESEHEMERARRIVSRKLAAGRGALELAG